MEIENKNNGFFGAEKTGQWVDVGGSCIWGC